MITLADIRWRLETMDHGRLARSALVVLATLLLAAGVWWWVFSRFRPPPSIFDTPVDGVLGYLAVKDFSQLPLEERIRFMREFADRFRGFDPGESAAAAAFLAGLSQPARDQLRENVKGVMKDALAEGAAEYMNLPPSERGAFIDGWLVKWQRTLEGAVTGRDSGKSDAERLAEMRREGERGERRRERFAGGGEVTDRGVTRFLDIWEGEVQGSSTPREQGQITRFLDDIRTRMFTQ
jgi:hypothetical protein